MALPVVRGSFFDLFLQALDSKLNIMGTVK